jgi:hypothetical protein
MPAPTLQAPALPAGTVGAPSLAAAAVASAKQQASQLITDLEGLRGSRVIVYWLPPLAQISDDAVVPFYDQLRCIGSQSKIDVVLYTVGGATEIPWRLVTLIRSYCKEFGVLIPHRAHSAGTLLAMGADEIMMTPLGTLGPIDPSRTHPLLPVRENASEAEPVSVQDLRHAMQFIREAGGPGTEMPYTPDAMAHIFEALFDKIHPLAIGAIEHSYALAKLIGRKCLSTHMDPAKNGPAIDHIVDTLCDQLKSHSYQIGREEARDIGLKAVDAPVDVDNVLTQMMLFYSARQAVLVPPTAGQSTTIPCGWIDSTTLHFQCDGTWSTSKEKGTQPAGSAWKTY